MLRLSISRCRLLYSAYQSPQFCGRHILLRRYAYKKQQCLMQNQWKLIFTLARKLPNMHSSSNIVCKYWIIVPKAKGRIFRLPTKNETLVGLHNNNIIWIEKTKILPQTSTFQIKFINYYNVHSTCVYVYKPWFNPSTHRYFFFLAVFF